MAKKILIVGGVAGGTSSVARLRRLDEQQEIRKKVELIKHRVLALSDKGYVGKSPG